MSLQISDEKRAEWRADLMFDLAAREKALAMRQKALSKGDEVTWRIGFYAVRVLNERILPLGLQVLDGLMGEW